MSLRRGTGATSLQPLLLCFPSVRLGAHVCGEGTILPGPRPSRNSPCCCHSTVGATACDGAKNPGEMEWGGGLGLAPLSAPCQGIAMCRGTCRKGTPRGRASPYQNCRSQWEESGGKTISGAETSFLGHHFICSLNLAQFLLTYTSPPFIRLSPELRYLAPWGTQGSASVTSPFHLTWGLLVQVSSHTLSNLGPSECGLLFF